MPDAPVIQFNRLSKRFGGATALDAVSFAIPGGEVHAVVGENGAGKSTLMKLLAGVHEPDDGEIRIETRSVRLKNPREARRHGISIVFQELNLFPHRTVAANIFVNREWAGRGGLIRRRAMREAARRVLSDLQIQLSPEALVGPLSIGEKQLVEIARTLEQQSRIIILDEPTSALNEAESRRLFEMIRRLRARGVTILYVSHRLEDVFAIADRISVLRDGRHQGTFATAETTIPQIIAAMIGRPLDNSFPPRPAAGAPGPVVLHVRELCRAPALGPISFVARAGEIIGFAGLEGAGMNELFRVLFGLDSMSSGQIVVHDALQRPTTPLAAIRRAWALVPESRRDEGLMMDWSISRNMTLLVLDKLLGRLGLIDRRQVQSTTDQFVRQLGIVTDSQDKKLTHLSGGNQQKVLLGKWLATGPSILLLNNPTRGVDVGAKQEIHAYCRQLASQGMTILMTSGEVEEVMGLADRVIVLAKGKVVREFQHGEVTKAGLLHSLAGAGPAERKDRPASSPDPEG